MVVDLACIMWLTVMDKQPVLAVAHRLYNGWTLVMSAFVALAFAAAATAQRAQGLSGCVPHSDMVRWSVDGRLMVG